MVYKTVYWDSVTQQQEERNCTPEEIAAIEAQKVRPLSRAELKEHREAAVAKLQVTTTAGNTFNGDETSQDRMTRAIVALSAAEPGTTVSWVLADNSVINATRTELAEALMLACAAQTAIWIIP